MGTVEYARLVASFGKVENMSFWDVVWLIVLGFLFIAYLMLLFSIFADLFRDHGVSGWMTALWVVFLIVFPFLGALVYLIVRGGSMTERSAAETLRRRDAEVQYIRRVARSDTTAQLADAYKLLEDGAITEAEFERIKRSVLG
ncbi:SHOCT domain-containing protein [Nocardia sp. BMG51109]|uniref:SHOCT domain-containing protein n=1 Tax=Nocardia sp. BMG51109 TaxID=1056816 RepID=UPI0004B52496|nr:SHOCT domain-containing protein [Nocardia sp. BMG51109]